MRETMMREVFCRRGGGRLRRAGLFVALAMLPAPSFAQGPAPNMEVTTPPKVDGGAVNGNQGGVAGTGLGKTTGKDVTGLGQSVSGPPGQGIDGVAVKKPDVPP